MGNRYHVEGVPLTALRSLAVGSFSAMKVRSKNGSLGACVYGAARLSSSFLFLSVMPKVVSRSAVSSSTDGRPFIYIFSFYFFPTSYFSF